MRTTTAIIYALASGLVLGVSFNYAYFLWPVILVGLIPFLHVLFQYKGKTKTVFLLGWLCGAIFMAVVLAWLWSTLPIDWIDTESNFFPIFTVFFSWIVANITLSFFIGLWAAFVYAIHRKLSHSAYAFILIVPVLWIVFEFLRTFGFFVITLGPGSLFGPHFSVGFLGYALAENEILLQLARFGGVYTLSFIVVFINALLYYFFVLYRHKTQNKWHRIFFICTALMIIIFYSALLIQPAHKEGGSGEKLTIALVHTSFDTSSNKTREAQNDKFNMNVQRIYEIKESGIVPDVIVFPEDTRFLKTLITQNKIQTFFKGLFGDNEILVVDSSRKTSPDGTVTSRLFYLNTKSGNIQTADKLFLVPQGEYLPYIYTIVSKLFRQGDVVDAFNNNRAYQNGGAVKGIKFRDSTVGGLFCSDIVSPVLYKQLVEKEGADILINVASQSRFHGSRTLYRQIKSIAKVRAVENNRYFIQSSNVAPSFILDNYGRVIIESKWEGSEVLFQEVSL